MTQTAVRSGVVVALLVVSTGCGTSGPTSPTARTEATSAPGPALPQPTPPLSGPPLSGPSRSFAFDHPLSYGVSEYTKRSRFIVYDSGAFALQYPICNCPGEYRGRYTDANGVLTFEWDGWSLAGPWGATGTLQGDTLTVRYNLIMQLTDFEDAVYQRVP